MMQDNPFADLIPQQPVQPQAPGVIYGRPKQAAPITPLQLRQEERRDATAERQAIASERSAATADRMVSNDTRRFANEDLDRQAKLRGEFEARPDVKRFATVRTAREQIRSLVNAPNTTAQDDIAMIFSFMRALDPNSVVREGEFATAQNSAGVPEQVRNYFNRALNGERLSPEQRRSFGQTVDTLYQQERDLYNQKAIQYRDLATRQGIDPDVVARRYVPDEPAPIAGGATPTITTGAGAPAGTDGIKFGAGPDSLDRKDLDFTQQLNQRFAQGQSGDEIRQWAASQGFALGEDFDKALSVRQKGGSATANLPVRNVPLAEQRGDGGFREGANAALRGAGDTLTLGLLDEIGAAGQTIFEGGTMEDNLRSQRAVDDYDEQYNFLPRLGGQIAGGFALPIPAGANTPMRLAGVGAGYGAAYGFGSTDGGLSERLGGAASGGLVGGAIGGAGGLLSQRLAARGGPGGGGGNVAGREVIQAASEAGIVDEAGRALVLPADVGGAVARGVTSGLRQSPFGAGPINRAAERINQAAGGRLGQIAGAEGAPLRQEALGELGQNAAQGYIDRTGAAASRAYSGARELAGDVPIQGTRALANIDAQLGELAATSNTDAPLIAGLQRLRSDLANGDQPSALTIDAIRRLRTSTRAEAVAEGLRGTDYNRRAGMILDDLSEDIASQLSPEASAAFRSADRAYAERLNTIDDVMTQVVGRNGDRSAEAVANRLIGLGRGDSARLRTFLNAVEPEEAGIIRGSLIQEMGRANSGQQTAAGDAFSLNTFLTNWDKMPARTRDTLFRGEHRQAIESLARYAQGARTATAMTNTSNTGNAVNVGMQMRSAVSGAAALGTMGGSAVVENLTGRLLGSRRFAQWLARAPRDPAQTGAWARRLSVIASREPALAPDIAPLQAALSQSPGRAAAANDEQQ